MTGVQTCALPILEVDHDQVDGGDAEVLDPLQVVGLAAVGEDAGVDGRVERLDPALQALGEAGDRGFETATD